MTNLSLQKHPKKSRIEQQQLFVPFFLIKLFFSSSSRGVHVVNCGKSKFTHCSCNVIARSIDALTEQEKGCIIVGYADLLVSCRSSCCCLEHVDKRRKKRKPKMWPHKLKKFLPLNRGLWVMCKYCCDSGYQQTNSFVSNLFKKSNFFYSTPLIIFVNRNFCFLDQARAGMVSPLVLEGGSSERGVITFATCGVGVGSAVGVGVAIGTGMTSTGIWSATASYQTASSS
jgi:hypothetical protein